MKLSISSTLACAAFLAASTSHAFAPASVSTTTRQGAVSSSALTATMDVEALLAKARQLKAEAAAAEDALHANRLDKVSNKNKELDGFIDKLFFADADTTSVTGVANRLKEHHWSTDRIMQIVRRLHDREVAASGKGHVVVASNDRVQQSNPQELTKVTGLIDRLMEAAELIDEEYMSVKRQSKEQKYLSHVDLDHWTVGDLAGHLKRQVGELRREHDEQFQDRLESFYEAQRKEKKHAPPKDSKKKKDDLDEYWPWEFWNMSNRQNMI